MQVSHGGREGDRSIDDDDDGRPCGKRGGVDGGTDDEKLRRREIPVSLRSDLCGEGKARHDPPLSTVPASYARMRQNPQLSFSDTMAYLGHAAGKEPLMSTEGRVRSSFSFCQRGLIERSREELFAFPPFFSEGRK